MLSDKSRKINDADVMEKIERLEVRAKRLDNFCVFPLFDPFCTIAFAVDNKNPISLGFPYKGRGGPSAELSIFFVAQTSLPVCCFLEDEAVNASRKILVCNLC